MPALSSCRSPDPSSENSWQSGEDKKDNKARRGFSASDSAEEEEGGRGGEGEDDSTAWTGAAAPAPAGEGGEGAGGLLPTPAETAAALLPPLLAFPLPLAAAPVGVEGAAGKCSGADLPPSVIVVSFGPDAEAESPLVANCRRRVGNSLLSASTL